MDTRYANPASGSDLEPYHGIATFMRLPASRDLEGVDVVIAGIPFDSGTTYRSGTRFGPRRIRESSSLLWGYNEAMSVFPTKVLKVVDYGDVKTIPVDILATMHQITATLPLSWPQTWSLSSSRCWP